VDPKIRLIFAPDLIRFLFYNILIIGRMASATIKIVTAQREFTSDQKQFFRRVTMALEQHDLSVLVEIKTKKSKQLKLRVV